MKRNRNIILILLAFSLIYYVYGVVRVVKVDITKTYPSFPPPRYTILCDDNGNYLPVMPHGTRLYEGYPYGGYDKYQDALNRAWKQYNYINPKQDTTNWHECKGVDHEPQP